MINYCDAVRIINDEEIPLKSILGFNSKTNEVLYRHSDEIIVQFESVKKNNNKKVNIYEIFEKGNKEYMIIEEPKETITIKYKLEG